MPQASHQEEDANTAYPLLVLTACPVDSRPAGAPLQWGGLKIRIKPSTRAFSIYGRAEIEETFNCSYELNPEYQHHLEKAGLHISGVSPEDRARIVELPGERFFMGLGFIPQLSSSFENPHPLLTAFLKAAFI